MQSFYSLTARSRCNRHPFLTLSQQRSLQLCHYATQLIRPNSSSKKKSQEKQSQTTKAKPQQQQQQQSTTPSSTIPTIPTSSLSSPNISRPSRFSSTDAPISPSERLNKAMIKSGLPPLNEWKFLYASSDSSSSQSSSGKRDVADVYAELDPSIIERVKNASTYKRWVIGLFIIGGALIFLSCVVRPNVTSRGNSEIYGYADLVLGNKSDYLKGEELLSSDQYAEQRRMAFKRLYAFCENWYNWPLLKNAKIVEIWTSAIHKHGGGGGGEEHEEEVVNLLYATRALNRLMDSSVFVHDCLEHLDPRDLVALLNRLNREIQRGTALDRKRCHLLRNNVHSLLAKYYSSLTLSTLQSFNGEREITSLIGQFLRSNNEEQNRIGYLGLEQLLHIGALDQYAELRSYVDKLYSRYATSQSQFNTITDKKLKEIVSNIAIEYETKYRVTAEPCVISKYKAPSDWNWIKWLESDASKLAQVYVLGGACWVFTRMYWRYWRFGGVRGRHNLFNYAFPHGKKALLYMTPVFLYQTLATNSWERLIFQTKDRQDFVVSQGMIPFIALLKYAPVILAVCYLVLTNPAVPFLIGPTQYGLLHGATVITPSMLGYCREEELDIETSKSIKSAVQTSQI